MNQFAKLFNLPDTQIVAIARDDEEGQPAIHYYWKPERLGVCECIISYESDNKRDAYFNSIDDEEILTTRERLKALGDRFQTNL